MNAEVVIITLSSIVIASYLFELLSKKTRIPSVLVLIVLGILLRQTNDHYEIIRFDFMRIVGSLGTVGLILIVFEGGLGISYEKRKNHIIRNSFYSALFVLILTTAGIAAFFQFMFNCSIQQAIANAIPFSIISSAIAIPSVSSLAPEKQEFTIYESSFSDILGIILFNYALTTTEFSGMILLRLITEIVLIVFVSIIFCLILLYMMKNLEHHIKSFLILSILTFIYAVGKYFHLSSLILVLIFGLFLKNAEIIEFPLFKKIFNYSRFKQDFLALHQITLEASFFIRTFFFIVFGFTINLIQLADQQVLFYGFILLVITYLSRYVLLYFIMPDHQVKPGIFMAPRGLISILLYLSLPASLFVSQIHTGLLLIIVLGTSLVMSAGLMLTKRHIIE